MTQTIDHVGINVSDYARSKAFYQRVLGAMGMEFVMEYGTAGGFGRDNKPDFWISQGKASYQTERHLEALTPIHVCFAARSAQDVDAFYRAAMELGAKDNGAPGLRPEYHANYYGAFVLDPDGHNVEAAFHGGAP